MSTRGWCAALIGALIVPSAFRAALVDGWMARYVPGAPPADSLQVVSGVVIGIVLLLLFAALTAFWSGAVNRWSAAGAGAVAGLLIGGMTYIRFGSAAAGVAGAVPIYPYLTASPPPPDLPAFYDCSLSMILWTYGLGGVLWLSGTFLGALAGLAVGARPSVRDDTEALPERVMVGILVAFCCLSLLMIVVLYSILLVNLERGRADVGSTPSVAFGVVHFMVLGTPMGVVLGLLILIWLRGRKETWRFGIETRGASWVFYDVGAAALLTIGALVFLERHVFLSALAVILLLIGVLGIVLILLGWKTAHVAKALAGTEAETHSFVPWLVRAIAGGLLCGSLAASWLMASSNNLTVMLIPLITTMVPLESGPETPPYTSALEMVRLIYTTQAADAMQAFYFSLAAFLVVMALSYGLLRFALRRRPAAEAVQMESPLTTETAEITEGANEKQSE